MMEHGGGAEPFDVAVEGPGVARWELEGSADVIGLLREVTERRRELLAREPGNVTGLYALNERRAARGEAPLARMTVHVNDAAGVLAAGARFDGLGRIVRDGRAVGVYAELVTRWREEAPPRRRRVVEILRALVPLRRGRGG